jgi:hypothetical protein
MSATQTLVVTYHCRATLASSFHHTVSSVYICHASLFDLTERMSFSGAMRLSKFCLVSSCCCLSVPSCHYSLPVPTHHRTIFFEGAAVPHISLLVSSSHGSSSSMSTPSRTCRPHAHSPPPQAVPKHVIPDTNDVHLGHLMHALAISLPPSLPVGVLYPGYRRSPVTAQ